MLGVLMPPGEEADSKDGDVYCRLLRSIYAINNVYKKKIVMRLSSCTPFTSPPTPRPTCHEDPPIGVPSDVVGDRGAMGMSGGMFLLHQAHRLVVAVTFATAFITGTIGSEND